MERHYPKNQFVGKWRNIFSHAKGIWNTYKREVNENGGGLAPKLPSDNVMKIVEVYGGHPKFEGTEGSFITFKVPELSIESNNDLLYIR